MRIVQLGIILLAVVTNAFGSSDTLYQKANGLYEDGEFEAALTLYHDILDSGYESPDLYYNMGNASFRSNSIGYAVLYYEKALKLDPSHQDAAHNLKFVSRYRVDAFEEVPEFFLRTWISSILLYLFTHGLALKKAGFFIALLGLLLFIFTLSSAVVQNREIKHPEHGIILSPSVTVRSTPSDSGTELFILHEGTRVRVNEEVTGWHNIRIIDGREGWIRDGEFETI
jgi:tetratricopeptide (TPR) repeat protein